ncbi:unnamed protein product, partial [Mycena citricolor]
YYHLLNLILLSSYREPEQGVVSTTHPTQVLNAARQYHRLRRIEDNLQRIHSARDTHDTAAGFTSMGLSVESKV